MGNARANAEGDAGRVLYFVDDASAVRKIDATGVHATPYAADVPVAGRGSQSQGRSVFIVSGGKLLRADPSGSWRTLAGSGTALDATVIDVRVGTGTSTINVLTANGLVRRGNLDSTGDVVWQEPTWFEGPPTAPFVSIELAESDFHLTATQSTSATRSTIASSY